MPSRTRTACLPLARLGLGLAALLCAPAEIDARDHDPAAEAGSADPSVELFQRESSKVKEVHAVGKIPLPAERLFAVLGDIERYPEIMPPTSRARLLAKQGATAWYHIVIDPPLVSRRDYCMRVELSRLSDGRLESSWHQTAEHCPAPERGVVRMRAAEGRWRLAPGADASTAVEYVAFTDPGGAIPAWMVNRSLSSTVQGIYRSLGKAAAEPRYARCRGEDFGCLPRAE